MTEKRLMQDNISSILDNIPPNLHPQHKYRCTAIERTWDIGAVICSNGTTQYKAYCTTCQGKGGSISYSSLKRMNIDEIKVVKSHDVVPCERCGSTAGSEGHHWAPRHLFEDYHLWPTSQLCRECHMEWHRRVTPHMSANDNTPKRKAA